MTDTEGGYQGPQNLVLRLRSRLADEPGVTSFMRCIVRALSMLALVATMVATGFATCAVEEYCVTVTYFLCLPVFMLAGLEWIGGGDGGDGGGGWMGAGDWKNFSHARASGARRITTTASIPIRSTT